MSKGNRKEVNKARTHQQAALTPESRPGHLRQSGSIMERKREHTARAQELGARALHYGPLKWQGQGEARASGEGLGTVRHRGGPVVGGEGEVHACMCTLRHRRLG